MSIQIASAVEQQSAVGDDIQRNLQDIRQACEGTAEASARSHCSAEQLAGLAGRLTQWPAFGQRYTKVNVVPAVAAYAALAKKYDMTLTQMALGFVRSRWFVASTIIGASSLAQLQETLPATLTPIPDELVAEIDAIHLRYTNPAP